MLKPRYKIGLNQRYDKVFAARLEKSPLLNPGQFRVNWTLLEGSSLRGLSGLLTEYSGRLSLSAALLATIGEEFERRQITARRMGRAELTEMPDDLQVELLECQAHHDVIFEEVGLITKLIAEHKAKAEAANSLSNRLRRAAPFLRASGIEVESGYVKRARRLLIRKGLQKTVATDAREEYQEVTCNDPCNAATIHEKRSLQPKPSNHAGCNDSNDGNDKIQTFSKGDGEEILVEEVEL